MRRAVLFLIMFLLPAGLFSQGRPVGAGSPQRRISIVLDLGSTFGGPGPGLADQLRLAGYDDTQSGGCLFGFCSGPIAHPREQKPGVAYGLSVRYAIERALSVGAGYSYNSLGGATGYRADPYALVRSDWKAKITWAGAFWTPLPGLRFGGGPAQFRLEQVGGSGWSGSRGGLMGEAGVEITPPAARVLLSLTARGYLVPAKDVELGGLSPVTLRTNWTHGTLLAGIGVRL